VRDVLSRLQWEGSTDTVVLVSFSRSVFFMGIDSVTILQTE
jgi:hypothetical protein